MLGGDNQRVIQPTLRRRKGDTMRIKRGVISPGRWASKRRSSAMGHDIIEAASSQVKERLHRYPDLVGKPFDLAKQCHQMIGADRSSSVIERSFGIVDDETLATEQVDDLSCGRITRHRKPAMVAKPRCTDFSRGQCHERMNRSVPWMSR